MCIVVTSIIVSAIACGPNYPPYLFTYREQVMKSLPDQIFKEEMTKILEPESPALIEQPPQGDSATIREEMSWIDSVYHPLLGEARRAPSLEKCKEIIAPLPEDLQLYLQGVWLFRDLDSKSRLLDAIVMFDSLIAIDTTGISPLSVRAQYMKGQTFNALSYKDSAIVALQQTRNLVIQGASDSLGLGNHSYFVESRILRERGDIGESIHLLVQQRAGSSSKDRTALQAKTRAILKDDSLFYKALKNTTAQQVLASYIANIYSANWVIMDNSSNVTNIERLIAIATENRDAIDQNALDNFAAASYRAGNYDLAKQLIEGGNSVMSNLILANMAIREGNIQRADHYFDRVIEEWPQFYYDRDYIYFMVARGNFEEAFIALFKSQSEDRDIEYMAERLFTLDQLLLIMEENSDLVAPYLSDLNPLIGRRLMREGRTAEALPYFLTDQDIAEQYHNAYHGAERSSGIDKAEYLYEIVTLLTESGMELIGYELGPDWTSTDGGIAGMKFPYKYEDGFASAREYQMLKETASPYDYRLHYRYKAAELALEAANLFPIGSQQYDALINSGQQAMRHRLLVDSRKSALGNYRDRYGAGEPNFDALR